MRSRAWRRPADCVARDRSLDAHATMAVQFTPLRSPRFPMKKYMCLICGWIYDEAEGAPEEGIPAGTRWEDVPPNWTCPECGARKEDFEMIEL